MARSAHRVEAKVLDDLADIAQGLVPGIRALAFYDQRASLVWTRGAKPSPALQQAVSTALSAGSEGAAESRQRIEVIALGPRQAAFAIPFRTGTRVAGVCVLTIAEATGAANLPRPAQLEKMLAPVMNCAARAFSEDAQERRAEIQSERTRELEWLIDISSGAPAGGDNDADEMLSRLLRAAIQRMHCVLGAVLIPDRQVTLIAHDADATDSDAHRALTRIRASVLDAAHRRQRVLVVNRLAERGVSALPYKVIAVPVLNGSDQPSGVLVFLRQQAGRDFEKRHLYLCKHLSRQISVMLARRFDQATGLHTRGALETHVRELMQTNPAARSACILHIDIDRLHLINERFGFDKGDQLIACFAQQLKPPLLPDDAVPARIAGDQFAAFLPGSSIDAAEVCAHTLHTALQTAVSVVLGAGAEATLSIGVAEISNGLEGLGRAFALAELACKAAKDHGRNRVECYRDADATMIRRSSDVATVGQLREALKSDGFTLFAQKILPLNERGHAGYELLLRVLDAAGRPLPPADFLSAAQRYDLLSQVDDWVVQHALAQAGKFRAALFESRIGLSINVSGTSLTDPAFWERVLQWLGESRLAPGLLTFEITENVALTNVAKASVTIAKLKSHGCKFALDDFGVGVNSLTYLKSLPVNRVKIDGSFIRDIVSNPRSEAMVRAIVALSREMGIETVAEYVANDAILQRVRKLGIDYAQGYAIAKPRSLHEMLTEVAEESARNFTRMQVEL